MHRIYVWTRSPKRERHLCHFSDALHFDVQAEIGGAIFITGRICRSGCLWWGRDQAKQQYSLSHTSERTHLVTTDGAVPTDWQLPLGSVFKLERCVTCEETWELWQSCVHVDHSRKDWTPEDQWWSIIDENSSESKSTESMHTDGPQLQTQCAKMEVKRKDRRVQGQL